MPINGKYFSLFLLKNAGSNGNDIRLVKLLGRAVTYPDICDIVVMARRVFHDSVIEIVANGTLIMKMENIFNE